MAQRDSDLIMGDDGHWVRPVGPWSRDKLYFLSRYLDAFTTSMREKWGSLHYIDLFSGPGVCKIREGGELIDGSPLLAANVNHKFVQLHLCDSDQRCTSSLAARLQMISQPREPDIQTGDANECVHKIVEKIPSRGCLSLAFLDPSGLHLHYSTLEALASRKIDLIIFFPDHIDALRNWKVYYKDKLNSNLDSVLGAGVEWREQLEHANDKAAKLTEMYETQLEKLGYHHRTTHRIMDKRRRLYKLIFCSKNRKGLQIWENIGRIQPDGQRELGFE